MECDTLCILILQLQHQLHQITPNGEKWIKTKVGFFKYNLQESLTVSQARVSNN